MVIDNADDITLNEWLDIWLSDYVSDIKIGTLVSYKSLSNNHIRKELGKYKLKTLKVPVIQKFYNNLLAKGLSPKYIKNIHGCLHRALDMAVKVEYLDKNYSSICSIPKGDPEEVNPLTEDEQKKLFEAMKGEEHEYLFLTDIFTGIRFDGGVDMEVSMDLLDQYLATLPAAQAASIASDKSESDSSFSL